MIHPLAPAALGLSIVLRRAGKGQLFLGRKQTRLFDFKAALPSMYPKAIFSHFSPILPSPKRSARLYTGTSSACPPRETCAAPRGRGISSLGQRTTRARERPWGGVHVPRRASSVLGPRRT